MPLLQIMQTYCLNCKKDTNNFGSKKVTKANELVKARLRCANCLVYRSRFLKQKPNKHNSNKTNLKLFIY